MGNEPKKYPLSKHTMNAEPEKKIYSGMLSLHSMGEVTGILFLSSIQQPLAQYFMEQLCYRRVSLRYWTTQRQMTLEEANENQVRVLVGDLKADYGSRYSEYTGYLWTDEEVNVGGHDLLEELKSHVGEWLIMDVTIFPRSQLSITR